MQIVVVGSQNPVKVLAVQNGFSKMFPELDFEYHTCSVLSGVSDQPSSDQETLQGAANRAINAANMMPEADYWIGIEGGIADFENEMIAYAWIVVKSRYGLGKGRSGTFFLPPTIATLIQEGKELGEADDIIFRRNNTKQNEGAIGLLTGNVINRISLYEHALILALLPFKNTQLYV